MKDYFITLLFFLSTLLAISSAINIPPDAVKFYLYTKETESNPEVLDINDPEAIGKSHFNPQNPVRVIIHGFLNNKDAPVNRLLRQAYLKKNDFNVIVVDWGKVAQNSFYAYAVSSLPSVGKVVAEMIQKLSEAGAKPSEMLVTGHSLGAHVAGFTGKQLPEKYRLGTIIGMDPAGPLFLTVKPSGRLDKSDADYVFVIHTNGAQLGLFKPIGNADLYFNNGLMQIGCGVDMSCSHSRAFQFLANAILRSPFSAAKCENENLLLAQKCQAQELDNHISAEPVDPKVEGIFYVQPPALD